MKILAVDDDDIILNILTQALTAIGDHAVFTSLSGSEALAQISDTSEAFDCFLLDIQMPGMTGIELCRKIREMPQYAVSPILMITAMADKRYIDDAFAVGATDYITKPFKIDNLVDRIGLAERISNHNRAAIANKAALLRPGNSGKSLRPLAFDTPIHVPDLDRFLDGQTFINYVDQLAQNAASPNSFVAIKLVDASTRFQSLGDRDFVYLITDVAEAITKSLTEHSGFVTYIGSGSFVCALETKDEITPEALETAIADEYYKLGIKQESNSPVDNLVVGRSIFSTGLTRRGVDISIEAALDNAHQRARELQGEDGIAETPSLRSIFAKILFN